MFLVVLTAVAAESTGAESPKSSPPLESFLTFPTRNQLVSWEDQDCSRLAWVVNTAGVSNVFGVTTRGR
jgi:hypothetical protein